MGFITNTCKNPNAGSSFDPPSRSVVLNGSNECISLGDVLNKSVTEKFSMALWYKTVGTYAGGTLFAKCHTADFGKPGYQITTVTGRVGSKLWGVEAGDGSTSRTRLTQISTAGWYHACLTHAGTAAAASCNWYINGVKTTTWLADVDGSGTSMANAQPLYLGRRARDDSSYYLACHLGGFASWNDELSEANAQSLYSGGFAQDLNSHAAAANLELWQYYTETTDLVTASAIPDYSSNSYTGSGINLAAGNLSEDVP